MSTGIKERLGEVYMELLDRKRLARLMVIQGVSQRELAKAAGWGSHSYLGRLLAVMSREVVPTRVGEFG